MGVGENFRGLVQKSGPMFQNSENCSLYVKIHAREVGAIEGFFTEFSFSEPRALQESRLAGGFAAFSSHRSESIVFRSRPHNSERRDLA